VGLAAVTLTGRSRYAIAPWTGVWLRRPVVRSHRPPEGRAVSEDLSFFVRVAGVDAPAYVHTGIPTSHAKGGIYLREVEFHRQRVTVAPLRNSYLRVREGSLTCAARPQDENERNGEEGRQQERAQTPEPVGKEEEQPSGPVRRDRRPPAKVVHHVEVVLGRWPVKEPEERVHDPSEHPPAFRRGRRCPRGVVRNVTDDEGLIARITPRGV
jgi:hypothetical protein